MFRGASKVTLDSKGRLALPTRYRERLVSRADGHLIITVYRQQCLLIYPLPEWEKIEQQLIRLPTLKKNTRQLQQMMVGYATEVDMDGHGRILVSAELREFAGLEKRTMLIGLGKKFELWEEERWNAWRDEWLAGEESDGTDLDAELQSLAL